MLVCGTCSNLCSSGLNIWFRVKKNNLDAHFSTTEIPKFLGEFLFHIAPDYLAKVKRQLDL